MTYYPDLDHETILPVKIAVENAKQDDSYLEDAPWDEEITTFIRKLAGEAVEAHTDSALLQNNGSEKWKTIEAEAASLYEDLREFGRELSTEDHTEKMSFYRTSTQLLEKIVSINERAMGLRHVAEFQDEIMAIMEDILSPDQRTEVMSRLRSITQQDIGSTPEGES